MKNTVLVAAFLSAVSAWCASGAETPAGVLEMRNIAHRGMWDKDIPQNTKEVIKRAYDEGATWVEADFFHTKAGQMIAIHDGKELREYTGCRKAVCNLTPEDVATLNLAPRGSGRTFRIPLLDEVLAAVPRHGVLQAEIKGYSPPMPTESAPPESNSGCSASIRLASSRPQRPSAPPDLRATTGTRLSDGPKRSAASDCSSRPRMRSGAD